MPMDENYSDEGGGQAQMPKGEDMSNEDRAAATEGKTALIDSDICPGMKPGDEMVVKIRRVMDKQYEVEYSPEPKDKESGPGEGEASAAPKDSEMASMME